LLYYFYLSLSFLIFTVYLYRQRLKDFLETHFRALKISNAATSDNNEETTKYMDADLSFDDAEYINESDQDCSDQTASTALPTMQSNFIVD
jgi:hypothetical protein